MSEKLAVLVVEDNPADIDLIFERLPEMGSVEFMIESASRLSEAITRLRHDGIDVVLLDLGLPDSQGLNTLRVLKDEVSRMPIVVLTGHDDEATGHAAVREGAQDYLVKGTMPPRMLGRILRFAVERKRSEDAIRESERFARSTLDGLSAHIAIIDETGTILAVNRAWRKFAEENLQTATNVCEGANYLTVCDCAIGDGSEEARQVAAATRAVLAAKQETFTLEYPCHSPDYERWFVVRVTRFPDKDQPHAVMAHENITERRQAEDERLRIEAQLRQAQKMEALGTLAGGIAHDFNNILGIITGYTEMANFDADEGSPLRSKLMEVLKAAHRAKDLVRQILAFARKTEQERQPVQIGLIVKEAMKMLRASLPSTIEIKVNVDSKAVVLGDATEIHQVLMNLCTNAAHAMRDQGGVLEASLTDLRFEPESSPPHPDLQPGPYLRLAVRDTGHGIAPSVLDHIFDPFFTTKEQGVGTGLGLSVVHGIVKSCGGAIQVASLPGKGTTFEVFFPALETGPKPPTVFFTPLPRGRERILFVDDEPALASVTKQMLERLGYEVDYRTNGIEGMEVFRNQMDKERFDLVITDMTMPHLTGTELAKQLLQLQPGLPILLCTGFSEKTDAEKARNLGIRGFLMKPVVLSDLAELVRKVLDEKGESTRQTREKR